MASGPAEEDFGDAISLTSTDDENDQEMLVDSILAERHIRGEPHYLLLWQNLPLRDGTWEPRRHLTEALVAEWELAKARRRGGLTSRSPVQDWKDAILKGYEERCARHNRRNLERARLGRPQTPMRPTRESLLEELSLFADDEEDDDQLGVEAGQHGSASSSEQGLPQNPPSETSSIPLKQPEEASEPSLPQPLPSNGPSYPAKQPTLGSQLGSDHDPSKNQRSLHIKQPPEGSEPGLSQSLSDNEPPSPTMQPAGGILETSASTAQSADTDRPQKSLRETLFGEPDENPPEKPKLTPPTRLKSALKAAETTSRGSVRFLIPPSETSDEVARRPSFSQRTPAAKSAAYTNIFLGGRTRKGRQSLSEIAADPGINPKFLNARLKRKIELQRRNREGTRVPVLRPAGLISLDHHNPQAPSGEQESADEAKDCDQANAKRRSPTKGVAHWEDEPMEIDPTDSLFVSDPTPSPTSDLHVPDHKVSQFDNHYNQEQPKGSKTISKIVQLGSDSPSVITLSFDGIPDETDVDWAKRFCSTEALIFTHTCTFHDLGCQTAPTGQLKIVSVCEGTVFSCTENDSLRSLASNLRLGSVGLLSIGEGFCVYMYFSGEPDGQSTQSKGDATLEYAIFEQIESLEPSALAPAPQLRVSRLLKGDESSASCPRPLGRVFGQTYGQLLPPFAKNAERHNFFIAFPPRAVQEGYLLFRWLRGSNSKCDIRAAWSPGHWESFLKLGHGVVIIHEDALWSMRSFPGFHHLLHGPRANYMFWMFSRSLSPLRALGSGESPPSRLGDIRLHRVFDPGAAFLVTPSFFVSEPENAYAFMKWFWTMFVKNVDPSRPRKLVLCAKVDEWMNHLSLEKLIMRHRCPPTAPEEERLAKGISDKAIQCRWKTLRMLQQLVADASSESAGRIILAPESIDGNDEQSLVNWFGWWSTLHIDQYRRFTVVGSGRQTEARLSRIVQTPNYRDNLMNDPDGQPPVLPSQRGPPPPLPAPRHSRGGEGSMIKSQLSRIVDEAKSVWSPVKLFWTPVGFSHTDIAFKLGDPNSKYATFDQWFQFFWRHFDSKSNRKGVHNSLAGLFYTFDEDQASSLTIHNVQRSPWAAVFRPANPHSRPWTESELFIWDIRYLDSISNGKRFCSSDLLETQRRLIEYVAEKTRDTLRLTDVWVGASGAYPTSANALEATIQWLENLPGMVRDWIPAPSKDLTGRGWSHVAPERIPEDEREDRERDRERDRKEDREEGRRGSLFPADAGTMQETLQSDDGTPPRKTIFHPPRRGADGRPGLSKCANWLYHEAQLNDPRLEGRDFAFTFKPTMDWYSEQCEEKRGFEHVKVVPWHEVFKMWKIDHTWQK